MTSLSLMYTFPRGLARSRGVQRNKHALIYSSYYPFYPPVATRVSPLDKKGTRAQIAQI